jgi:hypothetical protein
MKRIVFALTVFAIGVGASLDPPLLAQDLEWPGGVVVPVGAKTFDELQVIDHWNLRYHQQYDDFNLEEQVAQIKRNMNVASKLGFTSYLLFQKDAFPELLTWGGRHEPDDDLRRAVREVLDYATESGLDLYLHCNQFMWPDDVNVPFRDTPTAWETYRQALSELITLYPDLAGFEVTADETSGALGTRKSVLKFHNETARALRADGRERLALMRTWQRVGFLGTPQTLGKTDDHKVLFSVKNTSGDFGVVKEFDESFFKAVDDPGRLLVEFDAWREYETHNIFPVYLGDYWAPRIRRLAETGVKRIGLRFNWNSGRYPITERPWANWVNVFTFIRLAENPYADPDAILREFVGLYYPPEAHQAAFDLYKNSFGFVKDLYWIDGENIADHGHANREIKLDGKDVPADWLDRVNASLQPMLSTIAALPDAGSYKQDLHRGALAVAYLSKASAMQIGADGDPAILDEWQRTDPESFEELSGNRAVEMLTAKATRERQPSSATTDR